MESPRPAKRRSAGAVVSFGGATIAHVAAPLPSINSSDALRHRRGAEHLHRLGPRALAEFLAEVGATHGCFDDILNRLDEWRERLKPELLAAAGAEQFPPVLAEVPR